MGGTLCSLIGFRGSEEGMVGVSRGEKLGVVGVGDGLKETKKTALVQAPDTFWR